jgi:hypothetical protein
MGLTIPTNPLLVGHKKLSNTVTSPTAFIMFPIATFCFILYFWQGVLLQNSMLVTQIKKKEV